MNWCLGSDSGVRFKRQKTNFLEAIINRKAHSFLSLSIYDPLLESPGYPSVSLIPVEVAASETSSIAFSSHLHCRC